MTAYCLQIWSHGTKSRLVGNLPDPPLPAGCRLTPVVHWTCKTRVTLAPVFRSTQKDPPVFGDSILTQRTSVLSSRFRSEFRSRSIRRAIPQIGRIWI
jgi:hypothetical protein